MVDLFVYEEGRVRLNNPALVAIPEYRYVLDSDMGSATDPNGTKKERAFQEFLYMYLVSDHRSPHVAAGLPESEIMARAKKDCKFIPSWVPSGILNKAIERYKKDQNAVCVSLRILNSIKRGLQSTDSLLTSMADDIDKRIKEKDIEEEKYDKALLIAEKLLDIGTKLPKTIEGLGKAEEAVKRELSNIDIMRGGEQIPDSAKIENA